MGRDPDPVIVFALVAVTEGVTKLLGAVKQTTMPSVVQVVQETVQEARVRKAKEYHVDQWEVGPYTRLQAGKEVRVRGYTAAPRKESHAS
jgi:hypothetical protein